MNTNSITSYLTIIRRNDLKIQITLSFFGLKVNSGIFKLNTIDLCKIFKKMRLVFIVYISMKLVLFLKWFEIIYEIIDFDIQKTK